MRIASMVLLVVLALPGLAAAQEPAAAPTPPPATPHARMFHHKFVPGMELGAWWKNSDIVKEIGLTDSQAGQIEQTFVEHKLKLIDLHAELEKQEVQLQPLIDADQPDESRVGAQIDQVLAARGRLEKETTMMMLAIRRVLNVDQWKKLQAIQQQREPTFFRHFKHDGPIGEPMMFEHPLPPPPPDEP